MPRFLTLSLFVLLWAGLASAQCIPGSQNQQNTAQNCVAQFWYDGATNLQYMCSANALQPITTFYKSSSTLTSIVVSSNTGTINFATTSYLWPGALVTVAGSTTAALNGTYRVLTVSTTTATITTSGVGDATYSNAALTVSTLAPLINAPVWAIQVFTYTGTTLLSSYWAGNPSSTVPHGLRCSDRANY